MVASLTIVGFGSGASFLGALSTGLKVVPGYPGTHHPQPRTKPIVLTTQPPAGVGVALVGACMSISLALTNGIVECTLRDVALVLSCVVSIESDPRLAGWLTVDKEVLGCVEDDCWPYYLRSLAVSTAAFLFAPSFLLCLLPPDSDSKAKQPQRPAPSNHSTERTRTPHIHIHTHTTHTSVRLPAIQGGDWSEQELARDLFAPAGEVPQAVLVDEALKAGQTDSPVSLLHSLNALGNIFFWLLIFGYFSGIGSAVAIITSTRVRVRVRVCVCGGARSKHDAGNKEIWVTFTGGEHASWAVQITTGFSIANTFANVLSGWASDFLWTKVSTCIPFIHSFSSIHTTARAHRAYRTRMHRTHRTRFFVTSSSSRGTSC